MAKGTDKVKVTCYGDTKTMTRSKALSFYRQGMMCCDPDSSEYERYEMIVEGLEAGDMEVSDEY